MLSKKRKRCDWAANSPDFYQHYHDTAWGVPVHDDKIFFEFLILEGAQAGLSWETILKRRDGYSRAFHNFDVKKVARMTDHALEKLMHDDGIIRNRLKIWSARQNARVFIAIQKEFGSFDAYVWRFVGGKAINNRCKTKADMRITSPESDALSKDLKKRGMTFVGSTIIYAYMQATGLINDHLISCFRYKACCALK